MTGITGRVFRALALVDGRRIGRYEGVEFSKAIGDRTPIEIGGELALVWFNILHIADLGVIDLLFVIVLDLHDLVAGREGPAEPLDLAFARRIQCRLKLDVERAGTDTASVHRAQ